MLVVGPLLLLLIVPPAAPFHPEADGAVLELQTLRAMHLEQTLGPYSRFGWNHPGPLFFYLLAPFYALSGGLSIALFWGVIAINALCLAGMILLGWEAGGARLGAPLGAALALYVTHLGAFVLGSDWNPFATVAPLGLFLCLTALGRPSTLPLAALVGSYLVQTHVSYAAVAVLLGVTALARARRHGKAIASSLAVTLLVLSPAIYEEISGAPGNLTRLVTFSANQRGEREAGEILRVVAEQIVWPLRAFGGGGPRLGLDHSASLEGTVIQAGALAMHLGLVAGLALLAWRRGLRAEARLGLACLLAYAAVVLSTRGLPEWIHPHYVLWVSAVAAIAWALVVSVACRAFSRVVIVSAVLAVVCGVWSAARMIDAGIPPPGTDPRIGAATDRLVAWARHSGADRYLVTIEEDAWSQGASVVLQLAKASVPFSVEPRWVGMCGRQLAPTGRETVDLIVADRPVPGEVVADEGRIVIVARPR